MGNPQNAVHHGTMRASGERAAIGFLDAYADNDDPLVPLINARVQAFLMRRARLHVVNDGPDPGRTGLLPP